MTGTVRGGLQAVVAVLLLATSWAAAERGVDLDQKVQAPTGSLLAVTQERIAFDLASVQFPSRDPESVYPATDGSPFALRANVPTAETWWITVELDVLPTDPLTTQPIATLDLELHTEAVRPDPARGCVGSGAWIAVTSRVILVAIEGPGPCALDVHVRLRGTGTEAPGRYHGSLLWSLRRADR